MRRNLRTVLLTIQYSFRLTIPCKSKLNVTLKKLPLPLWSSYGLFSAPQIITSRSLLPAVSSPLTESEGKLPKRALEEREEEEGGKMDQTRRAYVRVKGGETSSK